MGVNDSSSLCAVILAGGRGSRLGGVDKGLLDFEGQTLAALLVGQVSSQCDDVLISANRNHHRYSVWARVVSDHKPSYQGPLAGMQAAFYASSADWICTLPCDSPTLPDRYIARMREAAAEAPLVLAHDGQSLQPVHALLHRSLLASLDAYLDSGGAKVRAWASEVGFAIADFADDVEHFRNANTPDDVHELRLK